MGVRLLAWFREKDDDTLAPQAGDIAEEETRAVDNTEDVKDIRRQVEQKNGLKAIRPGCFLRLKLSHSVLNGVRGNNVVELCHNDRGGGWCVVVEGEMVGSGLGEMGLEEELRGLPTGAGEGAIRLAEGRDILSITAVKDPLESAGLTGSRGPLHMESP